MRSAGLIVTVAILALGAEMGFAKTAVIPDPYAIVVPKAGVYTGAYCPDPDSHQVTEKSIYDFEDLVGRRLFFVHLFVNWLEDNPMGDPAQIPFPAQTCEMIHRRGSIPIITWQANIEARNPEHGFMLDRIAKGEFDDYLRSWADKIKRHPGPILLRWGHEMNGDWFSWSGEQNGAGKPMPGGGNTEASGPTRFRRAWNHVQNLFRIELVKNVQWVWSVYPGNPVGLAWNEIEAYWPGDDRVDWIGADVINWSRANREGWKRWKGFPELFDTLYGRLITGFPDKPIFLAELGCANQADQDDGDKAQWIKQAMRLLPKRPRIKAFCWYNESVEAQPGFYPANFRLDFAPHRKAFAGELASSFYLDKAPRHIVPPKNKTIRNFRSTSTMY